jgi:glutamate/tyrosine decarboxylase-like PLP-dependent enzyme
MDKACNVLAINIKKVPIEKDSRVPSKQHILKTVSDAQLQEKKYFIVVCNMMTTMFGSVDNPSNYTEAMSELGAEYKLHVDGAYGGFYYPFSNAHNTLNFANANVSSITLDAHKMAQAPYGTGIFLIRKGYMHYANTQEASYVKGEDFTLIGSRSGANAVAVWMILSKNGPNEWDEKIYILQKRTQWLCDQLSNMNMDYYRNEHSNIITISATSINTATANKFGLVPDDHHNPAWYKVVVMEHVTIEKLSALVNNIKKDQIQLATDLI